MRVVILSSRISGNDGVSLECVHWKKILTKMGHRVTFVAGNLDQAGIVIPQLHFQSPEVMELHDKVVYGKGNYRQIEEKIFDIAGTIEGRLRKLLNNRKKVDLLIVMNVLSLPMHFPLAVALGRVIDDFNIPTIARHNDFWWERKRYLRSQLFPFFEKWFPPNLAGIRHVVINSEAKRQLKLRMGIDSSIISDSFDFESSKIAKFDSYSRGFKKDFGISKDDIVFLQATRLVPRKRVELAIELVGKLNLPKTVLIIAGRSGDEGVEYEVKLREIAVKSGIKCLFIGDRIDTRRRVVAIANGDIPVRKKVYTLWDCYLNCDFVVYPTKIEGFGNQFIEATYFKKPIIITPYPVFKEDIAPLGFKVIKMSPKISTDVMRKIKSLTSNKKLADVMVENNFELGKENFSYQATEKKIEDILSTFRF